jgi:hypothetical protein
VTDVPIVNDGTGSGCIAFLDWAGKRGEVSAATAESMAVAVRKVLAVEAEPDGVDLRKVDPQDLFGRFETLNRLNYTTASLKAYRTRFFRAYGMYMSWLDKRPDWKTASASSNPAAARPAVRGSNSASAKRKPRVAGNATVTNPAPAKAPLAPDEAMVPYDMPLRRGLRARLVLPEMLTRDDAKRLCSFIDSLAFDQDEAAAEGTG